MSNTNRRVAVVTNVGAVLVSAQRRQHAARCASIAAAARKCTHPAECVVTSDASIRQCVECGEFL